MLTSTQIYYVLPKCIRSFIEVSFPPDIDRLPASLARPARSRATTRWRSDGGLWRSLPSPTFWGQFFGKSLDRTLSVCFISTDERRSSSQGAKATSPRTARSDRDPARFAIGSPDLPSPRLPEVPPGRRPPGLGPHGGLSRRTDAPVHGSRRTQGAGPAVAAKLSKVAGQVGSDLRAQSRIVRSRPLGYFFELVLFHH